MKEIGGFLEFEMKLPSILNSRTEYIKNMASEIALFGYI